MLILQWRVVSAIFVCLQQMSCLSHSAGSAVVTSSIENDYGGCVPHAFCDKPIEVVTSIKSYPENHQQLLNAFYPINEARPSSVIIAYFTNYTDPLPRECHIGTYPWDTYLSTNTSYSDVVWTVWTTSPIYQMATLSSFLEFAEYLPVISYYYLFNKSSPFQMKIRIACAKIPFTKNEPSSIEGANKQLFEFITLQISSLVSHYKDCSTLVLSAYIGTGQFTSEMWLGAKFDLNQHPIASMTWQNPLISRQVFVIIVLLLCPYIHNIVGKQLARHMKNSYCGYKWPIFWAVVFLSPVFNAYGVGQTVIIAYHSTRDGNYIQQNIVLASLLGVYEITIHVVLAVKHARKLTLPLPRILSLLTKSNTCCHRGCLAISVFWIFFSLSNLIVRIPGQVALISSNPYLHGFTTVAVSTFMAVCIVLMSIPFAIDRVFNPQLQYRLSSKRAARQVLLLLYMVVILVGFGSLTVSLALIVRLSKFGDKTHSVVRFLSYALSHVLFPIAFWIAKRLFTKMKTSARGLHTSHLCTNIVST